MNNSTAPKEENLVQDSSQTPSAEKQVEPQAEHLDWKDKYLRIYAEFENYKKRIARQQVDWLQMANEEIISALLPTLENFELALQPNEKNQQVPKSGIQIIYDKLFASLQQKGLTPIKPEVGDDFDYMHHEALTKMKVEDEKLNGKITEVVTKGYLLHNKVLKPAKIIIGTL
ncbi:MAG: nucleotide exchange factor GrpE [Bacteroidota bacterium]